MSISGFKCHKMGKSRVKSLILAIISANFHFLINSISPISDFERLETKCDVFSGVRVGKDENILHAKPEILGTFGKLSKSDFLEIVFQFVVGLLEREL